MPPDALSPSAVRDATAELGLALTAAQVEKLSAFAKLLLHWNATYNLTSIDEPQQVLTHHLLDCLAIIPTLVRVSPSPAVRVLDVGSGGGLPGIPLAIAMPPWHVTLIDKVGKKAAFLTQAKVELDLGNVEVVHARVETLRSAAFDVIVSRAFSSLGEFVRLSRAARAPRGIWVAMRGTEPIDAADALPPGVSIAGAVKLRVPRLDAERHLVVLRADSDSLPAPA